MSRRMADMTRETSVEAYRRIKADGVLSENQERVLFLIARYPDRTDREISNLYAEIFGGTDPNIVRPRRCELMEKGLIEESGHRKCSISGMTAIIWRVRLSDPQRSLF